jgi:hypothetical protein
VDDEAFARAGEGRDGRRIEAGKWQEDRAGDALAGELVWFSDIDESR